MTRRNNGLVFVTHSPKRIQLQRRGMDTVAFGMLNDGMNVESAPDQRYITHLILMTWIVFLCLPENKRTNSGHRSAPVIIRLCCRFLFHTLVKWSVFLQEVRLPLNVSFNKHLTAQRQPDKNFRRKKTIGNGTLDNQGQWREQMDSMRQERFASPVWSFRFALAVGKKKGGTTSSWLTQSTFNTSNNSDKQT